MNQSKNTVGRLLLSILTVAAVLFISSAVWGIKINNTPSLPVGLYQKIDRTIVELGDTVNFALPKDNKVINNNFDRIPYKHRPQYFLKLVYGVVGDCIYKDSTEVIVGVHHLPLLPGQESILQAESIPEGYVFVGTPHERSFDSRYYGLIKISSITGVYKPLLTRN